LASIATSPVIEFVGFSGDLDAFRAKVRADDDKLQSLLYLSFANIVAATWCPEKVEL
jgi:hypothetical protein